MEAEFSDSKLRVCLGILAATLLAHGFIAFMTVVISDDWFTLLAYQEASLRAAWKGAVYLSMPLTIIQAVPFFAIGDSLPVLRSINLVFAFGMGWLLFLCLERIYPAGRREAFWTAVFAVIFPGYLVHFMVSFIFYQICFILFLAGLWMSFNAEDAVSPGRRRTWRGLSYAVIFYSFQFGALLVFFPLFIIAQCGYCWRRNRAGLLSTARTYIRDHYIYLILPFLFWSMRISLRLFLPVWKEYNKPAFDLTAVSGGMIAFIADFFGILWSIVDSPWLAAALVVGLGLNFAFVKGKPGGRPSVKGLGAIAVGLAVLGLGILPFALVGKVPFTGPIDVRMLSAFDYATEQILEIIDRRMYLFMGLGFGLITANLVPSIVSRLRLRPGVSTAVLASLALSCIVEDNSFYLHIERQWLPMAGLRETLRANSELKRYAIFGIVDRIGDISTTWDSWVLFLASVWGDRSHFGVPERWYGAPLNAGLVYDPKHIANKLLYGGSWYPYMKPPSEACNEATLILSPGRRYNEKGDLGEILRYQYYRLFVRNRLSHYLQGFVRVTVIAKRNPEVMLAEPDFPQDWYELQRSETALERKVIQQSNVDSVIGSFLTRSSSEDGGREVVIEFDRPQPAMALGFDLLGANNTRLPLWQIARGEHVRLLGILDEGMRIAQVAVSGDSHFQLGELNGLRAAQSLRSARAEICKLDQPYFDPRQVGGEDYNGDYDMNRSVMEQLLIPNKPLSAGEITKEGSALLFEPKSADQTLLSDYVRLIPGRRLFAQIDWGTGSTLPVAISVEDEGGVPIQALAPPKLGGVELYELVPIAGHSQMGFRIVGRPGLPSRLPIRISVTQIGESLDLIGSIDEAFVMDDDGGWGQFSEKMERGRLP